MNQRWLLTALVAAIALPYAACTLDNPETPELSGPSELGLSIEMRAVPDQLVSDGFSSSIIEAVVRDSNGNRVSGRTITFDITTDGNLPTVGNFLDLGNLAPVNGARPAAGGVESGPVSAVSDGSGVARVRYWAPFRTDQENDTIVRITGRELSVNFANQRLARAVDIFLRAANRPSFPGQNSCAFIYEPDKLTYDIGEPIAFTASQLNGDVTIDGCVGNEIARYEWAFSDGTTKTGRDIVHAFSAEGTYTVILITREAVTGCRATCSVTLDVVP